MGKIKKAFFICPVRGASIENTMELVEGIESEGLLKVHWPPRDTNQEDPTGLRICTDNLAAIKEASIVYFMWDGKSQGCLFDLGMAFALGKKVVPVTMPPLTEGKSFQNMVDEYARVYR